MSSPASEALGLNDQICFALYNASRALTSYYRVLLEPLGLTYPQYLAILALDEFGPTSVAGLGEQLHLDSGTLSPLLKRLETSGIVARVRSAQDERSVEVSLTAEGKLLRDRAANIPDLICASTGLEIPDLVDLRSQVDALAASVRTMTAA
jgi:DNA-binding MarR family transcriptional regulator